MSRQKPVDPPQYRLVVFPEKEFDKYRVIGQVLCGDPKRPEETYWDNALELNNVRLHGAATFFAELGKK